MIKTIITLFILIPLTSCGIEPSGHKIVRNKHNLQQDGNLPTVPKPTPNQDADVQVDDSVKPKPEPEPVVDPELPEQDEPIEQLGEWHSLFFTGDNSIRAFDNAREEISGMFLSAGFTEENMTHLTKMDSLINQGMGAANHLTIRSALSNFEPKEDDLCFVHMTSHGSQSGFYLKGEAQLTPGQLDEMLELRCAKRPTVVLVSACYSGIFTASQKMQRPNRIILTAARKDRTSFGCSAENQYTYWDGCLIDELPVSKSWKNLHENIVECIERKEASGNFTRSLPQFFMGQDAERIPYPFNQ